MRSDVVVVGLGVQGTASAWELAERGLDVIGLDQFDEGHTRGSSHGRTRMIRRAYPNRAWNPLVDRAFAGWRRWEERSGETLVRRTGGLYVHPDSSSQLQGPDLEIVHDPARAAQLMTSFAMPGGHSAVYDPTAGVVEAAAALRVARAGARQRGAELAFGERMVDWCQEPGGDVVVTTDRRTIRADTLVLAPGAWVGGVVPELADLFEVWRILTVTVRPGQWAGLPPGLGCFSVNRPDGLLFGIPDVAGNGVKVGVDARQVWDPVLAPDPPTAAEIARLCALLTTVVPDLEPDVVDSVACLYTMTADRRFVVGRLPATPRVIVAAACSGHGFKFGPAIGEAVADLVTGRERPDLDFVGVARRTPSSVSIPGGRA